MAGAKTNSQRERILSKDFGQTNYVPDTSYWVGLYSVSPTAAGGGTELSYAGYARVEIVNSSGNWDASIVGRRSNVNAIAFPANAGVTTPTAVAFGLFSASSGGTLRRFGPVAPNDPIPPAKIPTYSANSLVITES